VPPLQEKGPDATWSVAQDGSGANKVLKVDANKSAAAFNVVFLDGARPADVEVSVRLRADSGKEDQGGGVVWRARDRANYYIARWNPLESNIRVYKVVDGGRTMFESAKVTTDDAALHQIAARMIGTKIEVLFDGKLMLQHSDDTFPGAGNVGLWTKADASTSFDDFQVRTIVK
jgi:hypothetical protein